MTVEEALNILNAGNDEDLEELFEEKLFGIKQYLTAKPLVSKLFLVQVEKLNKLHEVSVVLKLDQAEEDLGDQLTIFKDVPDILESFLAFEHLRAIYKKEVMNSRSALKLVVLTKGILDTQQIYLKCWPDCQLIEENEVIIGKEPDPMELIADLRKGRELGIVNFEDLNKLPIETLVTLSNEWKRVSLLRQKEKEWRTSSEN